jgi:hypothetical protein
MSGVMRHDPVNTGLTCTSGASTNNYPGCQGENLASASVAQSGGPPVAPSVESLVQAWVNEPKGPFSQNHYTQMVWRDTGGVGCATATVRGLTSNGLDGADAYLVCRYAPPGNVAINGVVQPAY